MPRTRVLALVFAILGLAVLARVASVSASSATMGFEDATLDTMPPSHAAVADLVRGTLALEGDVLRATIELASLPDMTAGMAYVFLFSNDTTELFAAAVTAPSLEYGYGTWSAAEGGPGDTHDAKGSFATGAPGSIVIDVPLLGLEGSTVLRAPRAFSADIKGGLPVVSLAVSEITIVDEATGQGELALPQPTSEAPAPDSAALGASPAPAAAPEKEQSAAEAAAPVPGFEAAMALAALAGALLAARRPEG